MSIFNIFLLGILKINWLYCCRSSTKYSRVIDRFHQCHVSRRPLIGKLELLLLHHYSKPQHFLNYRPCFISIVFVRSLISAATIQWYSSRRLEFSFIFCTIIINIIRWNRPLIPGNRSRYKKENAYDGWMRKKIEFFITQEIKHYASEYAREHFVFVFTMKRPDQARWRREMPGAHQLRLAHNYNNK